MKMSTSIDICWQLPVDIPLQPSVDISCRAFVKLCGECRVMISGILELRSLSFCRNAHPSYFLFISATLGRGVTSGIRAQERLSSPNLEAPYGIRGELLVKWGRVVTSRKPKGFLFFSSKKESSLFFSFILKLERSPVEFQRDLKTLAVMVSLFLFYLVLSWTTSFFSLVSCISLSPRHFMYLEPSRWRSPMNRSNPMSRSLLVFFLNLVTGEVRNPSVTFFFSFLFLLLDLLSRIFGGSTYIFICRSGSWKAISFRSGSTLFSILRSKAKVRTDVISSFFLSLSFHSRRVMVYVGDVYELDKGIRPMCAGVTWWNDIYVCLGRYIVSCWVMWQSRVGMIHRRSGHAACLRPGILKTHCFGLVAGDKCHDIADHFSYVGSGCQMYSVNGEGGGSSSR
ncbi:hypothetical protein F2Q70_00003690 [Brassica cretica]|uniref:Uncharacterized protein n=1 Tax=Brassica cretica TaxID=69181 RepID=A0A8S9IXB6_BRACR|nr:hypothetical protein F2Q70_00003690 [Brassica cretica]